MASKDAMPFDILKKKLMSRLETMGIRIIRTYEEVMFLAKSLCLNDHTYYLKHKQEFHACYFLLTFSRRKLHFCVVVPYHLIKYRLSMNISFSLFT